VTEVCRKNGRKVFLWFSWRIKELRKTDEGGFTLIELLAVVCKHVGRGKSRPFYVLTPAALRRDTRFVVCSPSKARNGGRRYRQ
jgi:hypothetical protein